MIYVKYRFINLSLRGSTMKTIITMIALCLLSAATSSFAAGGVKINGDVTLEQGASPPRVIYFSNGSSQLYASPWSFLKPSTDIYYNPDIPGNVGIGNAAPTEKLDVIGTILGTNATGNGVKGVSTSGHGVMGTSSSNVAVLGIHGGAISDVPFQSGVAGASATGIGVYGFSPSNTGVSGVSTSSTGVSGVSTNGSGVYGFSTNGSGVFAYSSTG
jgi:hypothetical protein